MTKIPRRVVIACFDESGKLADSEIVAFGGCVFAPESLQRFTQQWKSRLDSDELEYTSMKEAVHYRGPYSKWKNRADERDAVLRDLAALIAGAMALRIVSPIMTAEFKAMPHSFRAQMGNDPWYAGFEACVLGMLQSSTKIEAHIVCDLSEEYSEKCLRLFHKMRNRKPDVKERCSGISFADDEVHAGLQAADMIAYCARVNAFRNRTSPQPIIAELIATLKTSGETETAVLYRSEGNVLGDGEYQH